MTRHLYPALVIAVTLGASAPVAAQQTTRAQGTVRDTNGRAIRSATVRAENPGGDPSQLTATSDDKGRWGMVGLTPGTWQFVVEAPGYVEADVAVPIRLGSSSPLVFTLARDIGRIPGTLDRDIQQRITRANTMRDEGRFDQAISAYLEIRERNEKLTTIHLLLGDTYRRKAAQQQDPAARRTLLDLAIGEYDRLLQSDAEHAFARTEIESARGEAASLAIPSDR